jgi:hypothetical protein
MPVIDYLADLVNGSSDRPVADYGCADHRDAHTDDESTRSDGPTDNATRSES